MIDSVTVLGYECVIVKQLRPRAENRARPFPHLEAAMARGGADWSAVRRAYENGNQTVAEICSGFSISAPTLYRHLRDEGWQPRSSETLRHMKRDAPVENGGTSTERMLERLQDALELQMKEVEARLARHDVNLVSDTSVERDARTLASLVRTFERILELQESHSSQHSEPAEKPCQDTDDEDEDTMEHLDIDTFREELTRRLEDLRRTRGD